MNPDIQTSRICRTGNLGRTIVAFACLTFAGPVAMVHVAAQVAPPRSVTSAELAKYDTNRDGRLDADERARMDADRSAATDEAVVLTPFEVSASTDMGYEARDTLSGGRLKTELKDVPSQVQVMTAEFMKDLAIADIDDAISYSMNTEKASEFYDQNSPAVAGNNQTIQVFSGSPRTRGINVTTIGRDFFQTYLPVDGYNVERLTFAPGANNTLFGNATPAGAIDTTTKRALVHRRAYSISARFDDLGSDRYVWDFNEPIVKNIAAVRYVGMIDRRNEFREPAWRDQERHFLAATFTPVKRFAFRGWYEDYRSKAQPVRNTLAYDRYTPWVNAGRPAFDNSIWELAPGVAQAANNGIRATIPAAQNPANVFLRVPIGSNHYTYVVDGNGPQGMIKRNKTVMTQGMSALGVAPNRFDWSIVDDSIIPRYVAFTGNAIRNRQVARNYGAVINANPVEGLYVEAGFSRETFKHRAVDIMRNNEMMVYGDANRWAVDGNGDLRRNSDGSFVPNPNFGRRFVESTGQSSSGVTGLNVYDQQRLSVAYELDLKERGGWMKWLGRYNLAGMYDRLRQLNSGSVNSNPYIASALPGVADASVTLQPTSVAAAAVGTSAAVAGANPRIPIFRYFLPDPQHPGPAVVNLPFDFLQGGLIDLPNSAIPGGPATTQIAAFDSPYGAHSTSAGSYLGGKIGHSRTFSGQAYFIPYDGWDRLVVNYARRIDVVRNQRPNPAIPYPQVQAGYEYIDKAYDDISYDDYIDSDRGRKGSSNYGVVLHPFKWLSGHYAKMGSTQISGLIRYNLDGSLIPLGTGDGKEYGVTLRWRDRIQIRFNKYETLQLGTNTSVLKNNPALPTAAVGGFGNQIRDDLLLLEQAARLDGAPPPTDPRYHDWSNWLASRPLSANNVASQTPTFLGVSSGNARDILDFIVDRVSKGEEISVTGNPTANWRLSITGARNESSESNLAPQFFDIINDRLPVWGRHLTARTSIGSGNAQEIQHLLPVAVYNFYFIDNAIGVANVLARKYRVTATTSYSFREGILRGVRAGATYSWRSPAAIGYYSKTVRENPFATAAGLVERDVQMPDIQNPVLGETIVTFDLSLGYGRRVFKRYHWDVQLNVRNVLDRTELVPQRAMSTGQAINFGLDAPRSFILTNSVSF